MVDVQDFMNRADELFGKDEPKQAPGSGQSSNGQVDLKAYLNHHGIGYKIKANGSRTIYALDHCVFDLSHTNNDAAFFQDVNGMLGYHCFHNSCQGKGWQDAKRAISGDASMRPFMPGYTPNKNQKSKQNSEDDSSTEIKKQFPRGPFPWEVFPSKIAKSIKQLARACATSPTSLPGAAMAILASMIGALISISPKASWFEPLIFWLCDIRPSGAGKSPAGDELARPLIAYQTEAHKAYEAAYEEWRALPKKDRDLQKEPARARGYFASSLTIEGLRDDHSGHGGKVIIFDEVSQFVNSQNQYKGKGDDREAWIKLWGGKPARTLRAGKVYYVRGARVSFYGGIQPGVWRKSFSGEEGGIYLVDGTVFRILPIFEGSGFYPLTKEAWAGENRGAWDNAIRAAKNWADMQTDKKVLALNSEAQDVLIDWRNGLHQIMDDLPKAVRGFVPKLISYAIRFAGILYLMEVFHRGDEPGSILNRTDIEKGIKVSEFYLGHIIEAMEALVSENAEIPFEKTEQVVHLAETLQTLHGDLDKGMLAVGFIQENFNKTCSKGLEIKSPRLMGAILRRYGLTIARGIHDVNGMRRIKALQWDEKTKVFIETSLQSLQSLQDKENQILTYGDIENCKSPMSPSNGDSEANRETLETYENVSLHDKHIEIIADGDIGDMETSFSNANENQELDWSF